MFMPSVCQSLLKCFEFTPLLACFLSIYTKIEFTFLIAWVFCLLVFFLSFQTGSPYTVQASLELIL